MNTEPQTLCSPTEKLPANHTKFLFVTGGVMSSLGKGFTAANLAAVLQARGLSVAVQKLDPYLNVDPGTMSPHEHGEVFVTEDGCETDLDLGHYERLMGVNTSSKSNITAGRIYQTILQKERRGDYLGKTVQMVPHVTREIMNFVAQLDGTADVVMVEIGGTVGDIESLVFYEAIRQFALKRPAANSANGHPQCGFLHLTYAPYLEAAGELKTKPTQNAVRDLLHLGIVPNFIVVRSRHALPAAERAKIALFANVPEPHVISAPDVTSLYALPQHLHEEALDEVVLTHFGLQGSQPDLSDWNTLVAVDTTPEKTVHVGLVGKYNEVGDAYKSVIEALKHGGYAHRVKVKVHGVNAEDLEGLESNQVAEKLSPYDALLVPGGFGQRGVAGKLAAIRYARENKVPYLGICLGMQLAVIEFAQNVLGLKDAHSTEFYRETQHPLVGLMTEWQAGNDDAGTKISRDEKADLGGTMRLGAYPALLKEGSLAAELYQGANQTLGQLPLAATTALSPKFCVPISERHRHRYEVNRAYAEQLETAGLVISGWSPDGQLPEVVELPKHTHPFFIAGQFHPEFKSRPLAPHPLFAGLVGAALKK